MPSKLLSISLPMLLAGVAVAGGIRATLSPGTEPADTASLPDPAAAVAEAEPVPAADASPRPTRGGTSTLEPESPDSEAPVSAESALGTRRSLPDADVVEIEAFLDANVMASPLLAPMLDADEPEFRGLDAMADPAGAPSWRIGGDWAADALNPPSRSETGVGLGWR
jgi:hypothetical protein